jgi:hypothetical protein
VPVTAVSPTPRHALPALERLSARYALPCAASPQSVAAHVCAQARKLVVAASRWRAAEDESLLARYDLLDIRDGNNKRSVAEDAAPDEELIRPIEPRAEANRLDQAKTPARRVDPEAFAAAEPVLVIPREGSGKLEVARHQHSLLRERQVLLSRRSRSAKLVYASVAAARNDYFSLWHVKGSVTTQPTVANGAQGRRFTRRDGRIAHVQGRGAGRGWRGDGGRVASHDGLRALPPERRGVERRGQPTEA